MSKLRVLLLAAVCTLVVSTVPCTQPALAQDTDVAVEPDAAAPAAPADDAEKGRQAAVSALLILGLVCLVFLFLILFVVMWARRMRRMVNQPLPDQHPGDPLWYLRKPDRKPVSEDE